MKKRNYPQNKTVQNVKRERDPIPWRYCLLTLICGLFLVGGFFFAAKQHFAAIDFGIKNSRLRKQLDNLEDDKRRLLLDKELALSPAELTKSAKKFGITAVNSTMDLVVGSQPDSKPEPAAANVSNNKSADDAKNIQSFSAKTKTDSVAKDDKTTKDAKPKTDKKPEKTAERASDKKGNKI